MREQQSHCLLPGSLSCMHICARSVRADPHVFAQVAWLPFLPSLSLPLKTRCPSSNSNHRSQERGPLWQTQGARKSCWIALMTQCLPCTNLKKKKSACERTWKRDLSYLLKKGCEFIFMCFYVFSSVSVCEHVDMCICVAVCDSRALCWSLLSGHNGPAWGLSSTKRPSLNNEPSQIEEEPDQSITTLKGSQRFPWCIWYHLWYS